MPALTKTLLFLCCGLLAMARDLRWESGGQKPQRHLPKPAGVAQEKQLPDQPLVWRYPTLPTEEPVRHRVPVEPRKPPPAANSVAVACGESTIRVEAKKDLLGIGHHVKVEDVTLGGCPAVEDVQDQMLVFESELHGCGSQLQLDEDSLIYSFKLIYKPSPLGNSGIIRTQEVSINVECHYQRSEPGFWLPSPSRKHEVSSRRLTPISNQMSYSQGAEETLYFSFRLLADDGESTRPTHIYYLGDMMRFEVAVKQYHHAPLRVVVDSCVATIVPNVDTVPRYSFLGNNGCLFDSQLTESDSKFLPRTQEDKLQFEVEAFRFQQDDRGVLFITCNLRATAAGAAISASNKACSFANGWWEASGNHQACSCCNTVCHPSSGSRLPDTKWEQETVVGPITVKEKPLSE